MKEHSFLFVKEIYQIGAVSFQLKIQRLRNEGNLALFLMLMVIAGIWLTPAFLISWAGSQLRDIPKDAYVMLGKASGLTGKNLEENYQNSIDTLTAFTVPVSIDKSLDLAPEIKAGVEDILSKLKIKPVAEKDALVSITYSEKNENEKQQLFMKDLESMEQQSSAIQIQTTLFNYYFSKTFDAYWKWKSIQGVVKQNTAESEVWVMGHAANATSLFQRLVGIIPMAVVVLFLWSLHLMRNTATYGLTLDNERKMGLLAVFSSFLYPLPVLIYGRAWPSIVVSSLFIGMTIFIYGLVLNMADFMTLLIFSISVVSIFSSFVFLHLQWNILLVFLINHYLGRTFARLLTSPFVVLFFGSVRTALFAVFSLSGAGMFLIFSNIFNNPWVALGTCLMIALCIFMGSVMIAVLCQWRITNNSRAYQSC